MVLRGTDPVYSVEGYLITVTANLVLNIGPEPLNTPLPQHWNHRRTPLIQATIEGTAQKWFSDLRKLNPMGNVSHKSSQKKKKQYQRASCNEIRRFLKKNYKKTCQKNKNCGTKSIFLNPLHYKNTKLTEILLMTLTTQLEKIAIKREHHIHLQYENQK